MECLSLNMLSYGKAAMFHGLWNGCHDFFEAWQAYYGFNRWILATNYNLDPRHHFKIHKLFMPQFDWTPESSHFFSTLTICKAKSNTCSSKLTAMVNHDNHAKKWRDHDKIVACQPCFFQHELQNNRLFKK